MRKENYYGILLFMLVFSFPFASKIPIFDTTVVNFFLFRVLLLVGCVFLFVNNDLKFPIKGNLRFLLYLLLYLLCFGLISLIWAKDFNEALKDISYVVWGILILLVFYSLLKKLKNGLIILYKAWILVFSTFCVIAFIEIFAVLHFDSSFIYNLQKYDEFKRIFRAPIGGYTNPNDFVTFIVLSMPLMLFFQNNKNIIYHLILFVAAFILIYFSLSNLAFFSFVCFVFIVGLYIVYHVFIVRRQDFKLADEYATILSAKGIPKIIMAMVLLVCIVVAVSVNNFMIHDKSKEMMFVPFPKNKEGVKMIINGFAEGVHSDSHEVMPKAFESESYNIRKSLFINGICMAWNSKLIGVGAGQFMISLQNENVCIPIEKHSNPHNFSIELLSQYGIVALILFFLFLTSIMIRALKQLFQNYKNGISSQLLFIFILIPIYLIMSNAPSSFIPISYNWIVLTLLGFVSDFSHFNKEKAISS